ncbi:hypothetical protein ACWD3Z_00450 [Streptomyces sp. NPDC002740]
MHVQLAEGANAIAADVWTNGRFGLVLVLYYRKDGVFASEVYSSVADAEGRWGEVDHITGDMFQIDLQDPEAVSPNLVGSSFAVAAESDSMVFTGRPRSDEGYEMIRTFQIVISPSIRSVEIAKCDPGTRAWCSPIRKDLRSRMFILGLFPGERVSVSTKIQDSGDAGSRIELDYS